MKTVKVLVFSIREDYNARHLYRDFNAFDQLRPLAAMNGVDLQVYMKAYPMNGTSHLHDIKAADVVYCATPYFAPHADIVSLAKRFGKPVWVDHDDYVYDLHPATNKHAPAYMTQNFKKWTPQALSIADVLTASTGHLLDLLKPQAKTAKVHEVLHNALDDRHTYTKLNKEVNTNRVILWRGGGTHVRDLDSVGPEVVDLTHELDWHWTFWTEAGFCPLFPDLNHDPIFRQIPGKQPQPTQRCTFEMAIGLEQYLLKLSRIAPAISIVPLEDTRFNRCKSNIAWLETAAAGAACVAPNLPEWQQPGIVNYDNPAEFKSIVASLAKNPSRCKELNAKAREHIQKHFTLSVVNQKRWEILSQLI